MLGQDNNFHLLSLNILLTCLLVDVWILEGEVTYLSLPGVEGSTTLQGCQRVTYRVHNLTNKQLTWTDAQIEKVE